MRKMICLLALGAAGCSTAEAVNPGRIAKPEAHLMLPACQSPPYPKTEGNPDVRARWLVEDGQCDSLNRLKIDGLQRYARAVSSSKK
jgi:hypothetical protein